VADASLTIAIKTDPSDPLGNLGKQAKEAEKGVEGLGSAFAKVGVALGGIAALKGTFDFVLNATREMEDLTTQFITFTGSAQGAAKQMERLTQFASQSPFALAEVAEANRILLAFGSSTEQSIEQLRQLGEVSAGTGKDLSEIATIFGQIQAEGKLTGERFNQLIERGINIGPELAKSLGVASTSIRGLISDSKITADEVGKAFQKMTSEGGQFFGSTDRLSKTVSGSISTLKDNFSILAATIGGETKGPLNEFINLISRATEGNIRYLKEQQKIANENESQKRIRAITEELGGLDEQLKELQKQQKAGFSFFGDDASTIAGNIDSVTGSIQRLGLERLKLVKQEGVAESLSKDADAAKAAQALADKAQAERQAKQKEERDRKQEEDGKSAAQDLARLQEKEKKITEIAFQESAVRQAILAEQEGTQDEEKIARLQEREAELTAERLKIESDRLAQLGQFGQAELLRDQERINKKLAQEKAGDEKRKAQLKKSQDDEFNLLVQTGNARKQFDEQTYAQRVQTAQKGLSAIAELTKSKSREAFELGKAAAIAQAAISIPVTAIEAYKSLAGIPIVGPALGAVAAAAAIAIGTSRLNEIRSQRFAFAEGGIVPGVGNKDTVPALLTPGEVVVPKSNFEDLQKSLQSGVTADQIVLLQQSNEIQGKILNELVFGAVSDKLTQIVAGLGRVSDRVDALSLSVTTASSAGNTGDIPSEPPQVTPQPTSQAVQRKNKRQDVERSR
jgi:tape measure domain-containing protein